MTTPSIGPSDPHWLEYVRAFGPVLIAAIVAYIAFQQWRLSKATLREKLFERRMEVYSSVLEAISEITRSGKVELGQIYELGKAWRAASFLFGAEVPEYIDKVRKAAIKMRMHRQSIFDGMPKEKFDEHVEGENERLSFISEQFDPLFQVFLPYLSFQKHK